MGGQVRVLSATLLWLVLLLQGCSGGGGGNDQDVGGNDDNAPPPGTYTVTATVTGISGHVQGNEYAHFTLHYTDQDGAEQLDVMGTNTDGPFTFRTAFLPNAATYRVEFRDADGFAVRCSVENGTGTVAASNVTDVAITCVPTYTVGGQIKGIAVTTFTGLVLQTIHNAELAPALSTVYEYSTNPTRPFYTGGNAGFLPGDTYDISVGTQPTDSDATCFVRNGSGTVAEADVVNVEVLCTGVSVSYEVTGLSGSGLIVRLNGEAADGNGDMEMIEEHAIDNDGYYSFYDALFPGQRYRLEIHQQPSEPNQQCSVENGEGVTPEDSFYVTEVKVVCPTPYRSYRFDNQLTQNTDTPLASGEQTIGELYRSHTFGENAGVPLGNVSGFATSDLFKLHIDDEGAEGVVYSNASGKTFWVTAESPTGPRYAQQGVSHHNLTDLTTWWLFKKESDSATLQLEVSEVYMLGFDDTHARDAPGRLYTEAHLWVRAFRRSNEGEFTDEVFSRHGGIALEGKLLAPSAEIDWAVLDRVDPTAAYGLWKVDDFFFDLIGDEIGREPERVALAFLVDPIPIPIDISAVAVGEQFYVNARTVVLARNSLSPEGGTAVFLRDPATFDTGDASGEPLNDPGSVRVVAAEGLTLVAIESAPQPAPGAGVVVPPACESDQRSVLELGDAEYLVTEGAENSTRVSVVRTGSLAGLVSARVRIEGGTALADEDFEPREIDILFGNEDDHPRTVELPIIDDDVIEPDENLTVTLVEPQGCVDIGAQASAEVTIVDDDNRPGAIAFASDGFQVDESAGVATIQIVRTGGQLGMLDATLETSDGTALAGEGDYTPVLTTITFADGDTGPLEIQVPIGDDLLSEPDETFEIALSSFTSQINDPATTTVTIVDNDQNQANTVQFAAAGFVAVEARGRATISLTRFGDTSMPTSVTVTTSDGTATEGQDYEALSTLVEFAASEAAREIELVIVSDAVPEPDESVNLTLSAPSGVTLGTPATAELTITEEDASAWGSWQSDVEIDAAAGVANDAQIAFDSNGNALAMWYQETGNHTDIWSNYYEPGVGWGSAVLVEENDAAQYAGAPRVAFDGQGNALAVWVQTDAVTGNESAWTNRFTPGTGWGVPELIEDGSDAVFGNVELAVASNGDAVAVWTQFDGAQANIYANRYVASSGWLGAEVLNEQNEIVRSAHVAMDNDGNMLVVWQQAPTGVDWNIRARRFTQTTSWEPSELISTTSSGSATSARASFDSEGSAMVVWLQNPGFDRAVYATRHTEQDGWEVPELIGEGDGADQPRLAMGSGGSAIAVWQRPVTANGNVVIAAFANRYTPDTGWAGAEAISTGAVFYPKVAMNSDGNALAAWFELDAGGYSVWSNRYTLDVGWRFPEQIGSSGGLIGTFMPNLAFGPQGEAFAIWTRGGEVRVNNFRLSVLDEQ